MGVIINILAVIGLLTVICFIALLVLLVRSTSPSSAYYDRADYTIVCQDCKSSSCHGCVVYHGDEE